MTGESAAAGKPVSFTIPGTKIQMTFHGHLAKDPAYATSQNLVWVASDGKRERTVRVFLSDQLVWALKPPAEPDDYARVAAQLALARLRELVRTQGPQAVLEGEGDLDIALNTHNSSGEWDPDAAPP